jgi:hypothetical protein
MEFGEELPDILLQRALVMQQHSDVVIRRGAIREAVVEALVKEKIRSLASDPAFVSTTTTASAPATATATASAPASATTERAGAGGAAGVPLHIAAGMVKERLATLSLLRPARAGDNISTLQRLGGDVDVDPEFDLHPDTEICLGAASEPRRGADRRAAWRSRLS